MGKAIYMSFATQRGGAGKTPFTVLAASWLHYRMGYNVAVIDCDYPQSSLAGIRRRDVESVAGIPQHRKAAAEQHWVPAQADTGKPGASPKAGYAGKGCAGRRHFAL